MRKIIVGILAVATLVGAGVGCSRHERGMGGAGKAGKEQTTPAGQQPYGREQQPTGTNPMEKQQPGMGQQPGSQQQQRGTSGSSQQPGH
jgi:hypothetical protein